MSLPARSHVSRPVWVFLGSTFALSWPFLIFGFGWFSIQEAPLTRYLLSCTGMLMVSLSAFLTRALVERTGFADVGWRPASARVYLVVLAFNGLLWLLPAAAALAFGQLEWNPHLSPEEWAVVALSLGGFSVLAGFGEEFGWRGYLLPRLLTEPRAVRGVLLTVGLVWGIWHCAVALGPLVRAAFDGTASVISVAPTTVARCLHAIATSLALSVIFGSVWLKTQSILVCSFFHGAWLAIRDSAAHLLRYPPVFDAVTVAVLVVAWVMADRWLQQYSQQMALAVPR